MSIEIHAVQSESEARDIYRMRYEVYIEELGRTQKHADHDKREVEEPLDRGAVLWVAYENRRVVGTVRVNYASCSDLGDYEDLYQMARAGSVHPNHTSITTKMIVVPEHRNSSLAYRLAVAGYRGMLQAGILHDFIDVYPARIPFFERLGYRMHIPQVQHEEFGEVSVMRLDVRDVAHLTKVQSPLLRSLLQEPRVA